MFGIVGSGVVCVIGIMKEIEIIFVIVGVINLVFDWLLIFGYGFFLELGFVGVVYVMVLFFVFIFFGVMVIMLRYGLFGFGYIKYGLMGLCEILCFLVLIILM